MVLQGFALKAPGLLDANKPAETCEQEVFKPSKWQLEMIPPVAVGRLVGVLGVGFLE